MKIRIAALVLVGLSASIAPTQAHTNYPRIELTRWFDDERFVCIEWYMGGCVKYGTERRWDVQVDNNTNRGRPIYCRIQARDKNGNVVGRQAIQFRRVAAHSFRAKWTRWFPGKARKLTYRHCHFGWL
jgi:hypothetical protein